MERCAACAGRFAPRRIPSAGRDHDERHDPGDRASREPRTPFRLGRLRIRRRLRLGGDADLKRVDTDRIDDVLELRRAEIGDREIEPPLDLTIGVLGQTDRARLADALQSRGDIDAVAHQIAVALLDDVAKMNADAKLDAALGRQSGVALDHAVLHLDRKRTASTTLRNSMRLPSPVRLTIRP